MENMQVVLAAIFGSGVTSAVVTFALNSWHVGSKSKRSAAYLAQKIAFILERYAILAADSLGDHDAAIITDGHHGTTASKLTLFSELPESQDYDKLDAKILDRVLDFPDQIQLANSAIDQLFDFEGGEEAVAYAAKATNEIALSAIAIATELRLKNGLPKRNLDFEGYQVHKWLKDRLAKASA